MPRKRTLTGRQECILNRESTRRCRNRHENNTASNKLDFTELIKSFKCALEAVPPIFNPLTWVKLIKF